MSSGNNVPDEFTRFVEIVFGGSGDADGQSPSVPLQEIAYFLEAAHRAGGFTKQVFLEHAPQSFRRGGDNSNLPAFLALLDFAARATRQYSYMPIPALRIEQASSVQKPVVTPPQSARNAQPSIKQQLIDKFGGGDVRKAVKALDDLKVAHKSWDNVAQHLGELPEGQRIEVKPQTLQCTLSVLRKETRGSQSGS